ncbi:MAG TPA: hypothetical protein VF518_15185, partial [Polyangia bacterium]
MDKRFGLAIVICVAVLWGWWKLYPPTPPVPPAAPTQSTSTQATGSPQAAGQPVDPAKPSPGTPAPQAAPRAAEQELALDTSDARFLLSTWGGTLRQVKLRNRQFLLDPKNPESGITLVNTGKPELAPLRTTFAKADFALPDDAVWTPEQPAPDTVVFRTETDAVAIEKRY